MEDYASDGQKMESEMKKRHEDEERDTKERLDKELPIKLK